MTAGTSTASALPASIGGERVSGHYGLGVGQDALDFVDVDIRGDDPLFIDPRALRTLRTPWTDVCVALLQDFFGTVIDWIRRGRHAEARFLLRQLREPNETHLGLSRGRARGRALGPGSAHDVWDRSSRSASTSRASRRASLNVTSIWRWGGRVSHAAAATIVKVVGKRSVGCASRFE